MSIIYFNLWLEEQQEGLWELYKERMIQQGYYMEDVRDNFIYGYLSGYFSWNLTPEGSNFWRELSERWTDSLYNRYTSKVKLYVQPYNNLKRRVN